jgi:integrase
MARKLNKLTARMVLSLKPERRLGDGGGLHVLSKPGGKYWFFRYARDGKQHDLGIGYVDLIEARARAAKVRDLLAQGIDPLDAKRAPKASAAPSRTFLECAEALIAAKRLEWRSAKHARQWEDSLSVDCRPLHNISVAEITTADVLAVLKPSWTKRPETASRLRGRIEAVLDYAKAHGWRSGENPAAWRGNLAHILPRRPKLALRPHHAAMDYRKVPDFFLGLVANPSPHAAALALIVLTGTRRGEVLGMSWSELDIDGAVWTIPAVRTKAGREHRVPLSSIALAIIGERLVHREASPFVFPGRSHTLHKPMTDAGLRALTPAGTTIHGFRSAFRDWCGEETEFPREIAEAALGHVVGSGAEQAYRRGDALERRRTMMNAWANFLTRKD